MGQDLAITIQSGALLERDKLEVNSIVDEWERADKHWQNNQTIWLHMYSPGNLNL